VFFFVGRIPRVTSLGMLAFAAVLFRPLEAVIAFLAVRPVPFLGCLIVLREAKADGQCSHENEKTGEEEESIGTKGVLAIMSFSHHEVAACVTPSHKFSLLPLGYAIDLKQQICVVLPAQAVPTSRIEFCRQVAAWLTGDSEPRMLSARKPESETPTGRRTELRLKRARPEVRCVDVARVRELAAIRIRRKIGGRRGAPRNAQGKAHTG